MLVYVRLTFAPHITLTDLAAQSTSIGHLPDSLEILAAIDWSFDEEHRHGSNLRLVRESAVRFARWIPHVEPLSCDVLAPFFDLAACIDPSSSPQEFTVPEFSNHLSHYLASHIVPWYLKWQALSGKQPLPSCELDPFEPLLLCFQRGGRPYRYKGFMHIEHLASFPFGYGQWPDEFREEQPTSIADMDLDRLDREFNARRGG